jgi:endoglucanase
MAPLPRRSKGVGALRYGSVRGVTALVAVALAAAVFAGGAPGASSVRALDSGTRFFAPGPEAGAVQQALALLRAGQIRDALLLGAMELQPRAVWITQGTPTEARNEVRRTMLRAALQGAVPVLVAYNIPGRDCGGLSAGGALTTDAYKAWIDGFAAGIGDRKAVVILEPDGLGLLPSTNCGGPRADYPFTDAERFEELNYAVDRLEQQPGALVYLDGTHSHWLSTGDISSRLVQAGVQRAQGFFLNVSNFRATADSLKYGTWISECIAFANDPEEGGWRLGHYDWCASQYFSPFGPVNPDDISTWHFTDDWFAANLGTAQPTTHFVVDTSRNGQGPWTAPAGRYSDPQDWCNPPGRGLGLRATTSTGNALADAFLWVKVPGESDGTCTRGAPAGSVDPEWGLVDPAAGQWFPQQALQLAQLASPRLF